MAKDINTPQQDAFLDALFDPDVRGDIRLAMRKAGYSDNTSTSAVTNSLKDQIIERSKQYMALNSGKAIFNLVDLFDNPNRMGASNVINAAKEVLDRIGVVKQESGLDKLPKGAIILLPPKRTLPMIEGEFTVIEEVEE